MNWGHGIIAAFTLFAAYILFLVFSCIDQDVNLVAEDYYAQEVAFQDRINNTENALSIKDEISVKHEGSQVVISFPETLKGQITSGKAHFFRPSSEAHDVVLPISLDANSQMRLNASSLKTGRYELKLSWESNGKGYFVQKDLFL